MCVSPCQHIAKPFFDPQMDYGNILALIDSTSPEEFDLHWKKINTEKIQLSTAISGGLHIMIFAAVRGRIELIHHLSKRDVSVLNLGDPFGWPPLLNAVHVQQLEAVEALIELGCDVNISSVMPWTAHGCHVPKGATSLWVAIQTQNVAMVKLLKKFGAVAKPKPSPCGRKLLAEAARELIKDREERVLKLCDLLSSAPLALIQLIAEYT